LEEIYSDSARSQTIGLKFEGLAVNADCWPVLVRNNF
jgi:hypothetical protein